MRHFRQSLARRRRLLIAVLSTVIVVVVLFKIVAPFLISSTIVREGLEGAVEEWTGHDARIVGQTDIRFWPKPQITLRDITISKPSGGGERVLGKVSALSASFDLLEAVLGRPRFRDFRLIDPNIYVLREADGHLDWANDGRLSRAVRQAKVSGTGQDLPASDDAPIGDVDITRGIFEISDVASGRVIRLANINGNIHWPQLSRSLEITADGEFNGRKLTVDMGSSQPLVLLAGKSGNAFATVTSDLFRGRFQGVANLATNGFLSGDAQFSAPDFNALTAWTGTSLADGEKLKSLSLEAHLVTNEDVLRFEKLSLTLNDTKGTGILDLTRVQNRPPRLTGTLAFDRMDLTAMLTALAPRSGAEAGPDATPQTGGGLRAGLELDLRLSAQQAMLGPFKISEAAISVLNTVEQSRIDIADSDFENGRLTGRIGTIKGGAAGSVALRLAVQNADFGDIVKTLALPGPLPSASGSLDLALDVERPLTPQAWRNAKGTIRFRAAQGTIPGINITGIRQLATQRPYFPLSAAGTGSLPFDNMDVSANLAGGSADIVEGHITGSEGVLKLSGVVPFASNSLALSVALKRTGEDVTSFAAFIGGSWPDPVLWPISQTQAKPSD